LNQEAADEIAAGEILVTRDVMSSLGPLASDDN